MDTMTKFWLGILSVVVLAMFALKGSIDLLLTGELLLFILGFIGIVVATIAGKFVLTSSNVAEELFD